MAITELITSSRYSSERTGAAFNGDSPNLDYLRSYAVSLVLVDHLGLVFRPSMPGLYSVGLFGVLIFFVHTSLVLMLSMERSVRNETRLFIPFYIRRLFRIYPLSIVCVLLAPLAGYRTLSWSELSSNLLLIMNITRSEVAMAPLWSLPYEVQMYILLPAVFLFVVWCRSPWMTGGILLPLIILALIQPSVSARFDIVQYTGCFLPGILAYQLSSRSRFHWKWWIWPPFLVFMTLLFGLLNSLHLNPQFMSRWFACLLIGLAAPQFTQLPAGLLHSIVHTIAKYSYGVYLGHIFAIHLAFSTMGRYHWSVRVAIFIMAMLVFPWAAYVLVENPGIRLGKYVAHRLSRPYEMRTSAQ